MGTGMALIGLVVLGLPVAVIAAFAVRRGPALFAAAFHPARPLEPGWPRGVQEEDPSFDRTWRLGPSSAAAPAGVSHAADPDDEPSPAVARVRATLRRR